MVVSLIELACLDAQVWLGTGEKAASRMRLVQSTISRNVRKVIKEFLLGSCRHSGRLWIQGDQTLLNQQRELHQRYRWLHELPLRLDAQYYSGPLLCNPAPAGWLLGEFDFMDVATPLQLLRDGILDAWIGVYPDTPDPHDPDLCCLHLCRYPIHLVVAQGHPLLAHDERVTLDDIKAFPSLALPDGAYPVLQQRLEALGLWNSPTRLHRYKHERWEGQTADQVTVGYASAFTLKLFPIQQQVLPIDLDLEAGDCLIVRRRYRDHPRLVALLDQLQRRVAEMARSVEDLRVVPLQGTSDQA